MIIELTLKEYILNLVSSDTHHIPEIIVEYDYPRQSLGTVLFSSDHCIAITFETWAPGLWIGLEGYRVMITNPNDDALIGPFQISGIELDTRFIYFIEPIPTLNLTGSQVYLVKS